MQAEKNCPPHQVKVPTLLPFSWSFSRALNFSSGLYSAQHKPNATCKKTTLCFSGCLSPQQPADAPSILSQARTDFSLILLCPSTAQQCSCAHASVHPVPSQNDRGTVAGASPVLELLSVTSPSTTKGPLAQTSIQSPKNFRELTIHQALGQLSCPPGR